ncbi:MAG: cell division protein FtsH [Porticoccus sp.]|uniref:ATP-dependent zinc metalloprotease FtsH n=1 Tax=Porticoccus TaxID=1123967 RepID=UPI000C6C1453|nr:MULTISPECIES: ATP-dependent zinc metalloprotease FtsH [Porticoccus]MAZ70962.1 cell division protein FtsH [Porticoccus sp.]MBG58476.1 cell division protein FtsH [Porticoccus sp.]
MNKKQQLNLVYLFVALWGVVLFQTFWGHTASQAQLSYSEFERYLQQGWLKDLVVDQQTIRGSFKEPIEGKDHFVTPRVDIDLAEKLAPYNVDYKGVVSGGPLATLIGWIAPALVFFLVWFLMFRKFADKQGMGGMMNIGKSKAKVLVEKDTGVTFDDVAGVDEAKEELVEVVQFLKEPGRYSRLGAHIPKGVLLVGPPGTGKTLIARAVAGEAGVAFFSISGSEFIEMFVGVGAARVRDLFEQAKQHAPAIIFIDELDALGRVRGVGPMSGGHDEREQTLNQLLSELDGFNPSEGVIILAATNRPEILDPALLRAGRFDRQVLVDRPDKVGREQILRVHMVKIQTDEAVSIEAVASLTTGFSGADLANLVNESALLATRRGADSVSMEDFVNAIERIIAGLEKKNKLINPQEKAIVAHHEMGHALVGMALSPEQPIQKVSIIPRGVGALGYTIQRPSEDRYLMSKKDLQNRIAVLLAGRAAEQLIFSEVTTGAADDLVKATDIARAMVTQYGMSDEIGMLSIESQKSQFLDQSIDDSGLRFGPDMAQRVSAAVNQLLNEAFQLATDILSLNQSVLEETAQQLLAEETLDDHVLATIKQKISVSDAIEQAAFSRYLSGEHR